MRLRLTAALVLVAALASAARADSGRALGLDELIDLSQEIVVGEVVGSTARWQGRFVVTDTEVRIEEGLKGNPPPTVTITQPGGTAVHPRLGAAVTTQASTFTSFVPGEAVILFVDRQRGQRSLVGAQQGKLVVAPPAGGKTGGLAVGPRKLMLAPGAPPGLIDTRGMTLEELRERVAARGKAGGRR